MSNDKTAADVFSEVGRALYGSDDWLEPMAPALGVKRDTLRNVRRGNMVVSPDHGMFDDLLALAERRAEETARARDALKAWLTKHRA